MPFDPKRLVPDSGPRFDPKRLVSEADLTSDPSPETGTGQFLAGAGKGFSDLGLGINQLLMELGTPSEEMEPGPAQELKAALESDVAGRIEESRRLDAPLMENVPAIAGNIAAKIVSALPTAFIPGAATVTGGAAIGAGLGAVEPVAEDESRLRNIGIGAVGGGAGAGLVRGVSRALAPRTAAGVSELMEEGVTPTPGQILGASDTTFGRAVKTAEESARSVPIVGDAIRRSQVRAAESFNKAALNRVLQPLGAKIDNVGRDALEQVHGFISQSYDDILPRLRIQTDRTFGQELDRLRELVRTMPPAQARQFEEVLSQNLARFPQTGRMSGETMKEIDSTIGQLAREYRRSLEVDPRRLGNAFTELQAIFRRLVQRTNPRDASTLRGIDEAYSRLLRVEDAASRAGSKDGVFSPAALRQAVRRLDPSARKRAFTQGRAQMQDLAEAGERIIGPTIPDSGTANRLLNALLLGGGYYINPLLAAGALGASGLYSRAGQAALATALVRRPELMRAAGQRLLPAAPVGGIAGGALTTENR